LLTRAHAELLSCTEQIADPEAQKRFLEQVAAHREIMHASQEGA